MVALVVQLLLVVMDMPLLLLEELAASGRSWSSSGGVLHMRVSIGQAMVVASIVVVIGVEGLAVVLHHVGCGSRGRGRWGQGVGRGSSAQAKGLQTGRIAFTLF